MQKTHIHITGLVQGVGFRPYIFRLAHELKLTGCVNNQSNGVAIEVHGSAKAIHELITRIPKEAPVASRIDTLIITPSNHPNYETFTILKSDMRTMQITSVSPDLATCDLCLDELKTMPHRVHYPFINCTQCGPRFSIIQKLPYDRAHTTMQNFKMCISCQHEYDNPTNRRFHAQPNACEICGPRYSLTITLPTHQAKPQKTTNSWLHQTTQIIMDGGIMAIKSLGGFHLACNAFNQTAVLRLREIKHREQKPFAVLFRDISTIHKYANITPEEADLLMCIKRPIVIVNRTQKLMAPAVCQGLPTIGAMLPYTPVHHLLMTHLNCDALVLTSGNLKDEPIIMTNHEALAQFTPLVNGILTYNRDIHNRCDDSIIHVVRSKPRVLRRSRGYAPERIAMIDTVEGIIAAGAELKSVFAIGKENDAILSQYIGDLKTAEVLTFYDESLTRYRDLFNINPTLAVHDLHPDYLSTQAMIKLGIPTLAVQHHYAHIAACIAEFQLEKKVIGFSFDGTGLGDDGHIWGGECFCADLEHYSREIHFNYIPMPGGDRAAEEPWRMALAYLVDAFGADAGTLPLPFLHKLETDKLKGVMHMIQRKLNCPLTSSVGRLFDAIAAIIGLQSIHGFEAEAAIRLESAINKATLDEKLFIYPYTLTTTISVAPMIRAIVNDVIQGTSTASISLRFHLTLVDIIATVAKQLRTKYSLNDVVLSGGVFQNRFLLENAENQLEQEGFNVFSPQAIPCNDSGIALGQLAIAARRRKLINKEKLHTSAESFASLSKHIKLST